MLRGYVGDRSAKPVFAQDSNLFDGEAVAQLAGSLVRPRKQQAGWCVNCMLAAGAARPA